MLVNLSAADLIIITAHYNNLIAAQYAEIERIEGLEEHSASDFELFGALIDTRADLLAKAHEDMAFFRAELAKFSDLVSTAHAQVGGF